MLNVFDRNVVISLNRKAHFTNFRVLVSQLLQKVKLFYLLNTSQYLMYIKIHILGIA